MLARAASATTVSGMPSPIARVWTMEAFTDWIGWFLSLPMYEWDILWPAAAIRRDTSRSVQPCPSSMDWMS